MSLNNKEISLILTELQLEGYWIQKITQPSQHSLLLHLYKKSQLLLYITLASGEVRIHSIKNKMPKQEKTMRFVQLLRSKILGGKILYATQLDENRIVFLKIANTGVQYKLYIKLWNNAANIILADENDKIIDVFYRRKNKREFAKEIFVIPEKRATTKLFIIREYDKTITFNEAIEKEYNEHSKVLSRSALLEEAQKFFHRREKQIEKLITKLKEKEITFSNADTLKHIGDLIINNIYIIKKGMTSISVFDYTTNEEVTIILDNLKTPQENANDYYIRYKKAISGLAKIKEEITKYKNKIEALKNEYKLFSTEQNIVVMSKNLDKMKQQNSQQQYKHEEERIGLRFVVEGWIILVGRSSKENDYLLRHEAKGKDIWLHTRDYPGGFVFIKTKGTSKNIPTKVLIAACNLAVFYSKGRKAGEADLYKTEVKNLRRAKGAAIGTVLPYHEKNIYIKLDQTLIENLKETIN